MLKHKLLLEDGHVLTSGEGTGSAIRSVTLTEQVSDSTDLCPGAACAACAEIELWAPEDEWGITQGDRLTLTRLDTDTGTETAAGVFLAEKPTRESANLYRVTAYDRMTLFDRDMTDWLAGQQDSFPMALAAFLQKLCEACGVEPAEGTLETLPDGGYEIRSFRTQEVTGRQLLQWAAQAAGRFARMNGEGRLELDWYPLHRGMPAVAAPETGRVPAALRLAGQVVRTAPGQVWRIGQTAGYYLQDSLRYEDYETAPVDKVQLKQTESDVGTIWPPDEAGTNALVIRGNRLLTTDSAALLQPVAQTVFAAMEGARYTPLELTMPFDEAVRPGTRLDVVDARGQMYHTLVMKRTVTGQNMKLESTGNARRDTTTAVNERTYQDLQGKVLEMKSTVDGLELCAQQDFPGNQMETVSWRRGHSGTEAGGTVTLNGRQAVLQGDGTGSCGAAADLPDTVRELLPGAEVEFSVRYRVTSAITIGEAGVVGAYIRGFAEYEEDGTQQSAWASLAQVADADNPAPAGNWVTATARLHLPSVTLKRVYLFANIQSGTGILEVEDPGLEILSAKTTALQLNAEGVELSSARIAFTGMVEFSDLAESGRTTINGANITTGTLDASRVNVTNLTADNIKSGTLASQNGALTVDLNRADLAVGSGASLKVGSSTDYTRFLWNGFDSYTGGELRSGMENNWSWYNRSLTAIFSTSGLTGVGYKNAAGSLQVGYTYDPYSDIQSGYVNYLNGAAYCNDTSSARIQRCRYQVFLENSVAGQNDAQIQAYDDALRVYGQGLYVNGSIGCSGAKNRIVTTDHYGTRALNAMESAAALFCDNGSGTLDEDGLCLLTIHPVVEECLDPHGIPQWLVTGAAPGFWVEKQGRDALVHGPAGASFDWLVMAPQQGYSDCYADAMPAREQEPDGTADTELDAVAAQMARRIRELDGLTDAVAAAWARLEEKEEPA